MCTLYTYVDITGISTANMGWQHQIFDDKSDQILNEDIWQWSTEHWITISECINRGDSAEKFQFEVRQLVFIGSDDHWWDIDGWLFELIEWQRQVFNYSSSTLFGLRGTDKSFASFHSFNLLNWLPRWLEIMDGKTIGFMRKHSNTSHLIISRVWIAQV